MSDEYVLMLDGESQGPFSAQQLRAMVRNGEITRDNLVAVAGWPDWKKVGELPMFAIPPKPPAPRLTMPTGIGSKGPLGREQIKAADSWGLLLIFTICFAPIGLALLRGHRNIVAIAVLNLVINIVAFSFLWLGVAGWVVALIWSLYEDKPASGKAG